MDSLKKSTIYSVGQNRGVCVKNALFSKPLDEWITLKHKNKNLTTHVREIYYLLLSEGPTTRIHKPISQISETARTYAKFNEWKLLKCCSYMS